MCTLFVLSIRKKNLWPQRGARGRVYIQGVVARAFGTKARPGARPGAQSPAIKFFLWPKTSDPFPCCMRRKMPEYYSDKVIINLNKIRIKTILLTW